MHQGLRTAIPPKSTLALAAGVIGITALPVLIPALQDPLRYERAAVVAGEYWRLLTASLVHTNLYHWLLNMGGLLLALMLFESPIPVLRWCVVLLLSALASTTGLLLSPDILWYVGLSGSLHGLFIYGAITDWRAGARLGAGILFVVVGKLLWEQVYGAESGTEQLIQAKVITDAHLWGGVGGLVLGLGPLGRLRKRD